MLDAYVMFGMTDSDKYMLKPEVIEAAKSAILQAIKSELPEEARRMDVVCYLLDETKKRAETYILNL